MFSYSKLDIHQIAILAIIQFCRTAKDPKVFGKMQEAFVYTLRDYVEYMLMGHSKLASEKLDEAEKLIVRARHLQLSLLKKTCNGEQNEDCNGAASSGD